MKLRDIRLRQIRLLPVDILAGAALFLLKGTGIMTGGGYILTGPSPVFAAGGGADSGGGEADAGGDATLTLPVEPTMTDQDPVLNDGAPTLPLRGEADQHGTPAAADGGHGDTPAEADGGHGDTPVAETAAAGGDGSETTGAGGHGDPVTDVALAECPPIEVAAPADDGHGGGGADEIDGFDFIKQREDCTIDPGINEHGDALPLIKDGAGNKVPLAEGQIEVESENAVLERLAARREELDLMESELDMRLALVDAAEKRIEERTAVLEALEARINAMVDEKRTLEEAQFVGVVSMYETMKAKDAAAIFDELDISILLRVARAINPRKMAPIMAKMNPQKAMELTAGLAVDQVEPTIEMTGEDLAALPQIIGQ